MSTRILPALLLLPLLAACVEAPDNPPAEEEASTLEAVAAPAPADVPAPAAPSIAVGEPNPAIPASNITTPPARAPEARAVLGAPPPPGETPAAEATVEADAPAEPAPAGRLGTTVASLGSPAQGGLWLETPLVEAATSGRIEYNGQSVTVELRPSGGEPGSGSQISIEAMRALGISPTSLPELVVFAG